MISPKRVAAGNTNHEGKVVDYFYFRLKHCTQAPVTPDPEIERVN